VLAQRLLGEVTQALRDQLAALVQILHALGHDLDGHAVDIDLAAPAAAIANRDIRPISTIDDRFPLAGSVAIRRIRGR